MLPCELRAERGEITDQQLGDTAKKILPRGTSKRLNPHYGPHNIMVSSSGRFRITPKETQRCLPSRPFHADIILRPMKSWEKVLGQEPPWRGLLQLNSQDISKPIFQGLCLATECFCPIFLGLDDHTCSESWRCILGSHLSKRSLLA